MGKPVAVLSSNDGCVVARSQEVRDLGIPMGIPYFQIKDTCKKEKITLFSSNFTLYRDISKRVMSALREEYGVCEVYSIDEAFFSVADTCTTKQLMEIRTRIMQKTGIPVSIGIASTKTRAKAASKYAKKGSGVYRMDEELWTRVSAELLCGSIWGIGRQTAVFLTKNNIHTVSELLSQNLAFIRQSLGVVGERLYLELSGTPVYLLGEHSNEDQQSYTSSRSFGKSVTDKMTLMSALGHHVAHVAEKLRTDSCVASTVTVIAQGSRFGAFSHREGTARVVLSVPTNDTTILTREVSKLLDVLYSSDIPYKKAGVTMSGIMPESSVSASLFDSADVQEKTKALNLLTDSLNHKFGSGTVRHAVTLGGEKWKEQSALISKSYTTKWAEIASVKAM
jgi:DNA polymerase V